MKLIVLQSRYSTNPICIPSQNIAAFGPANEDGVCWISLVGSTDEYYVSMTLTDLADTILNPCTTIEEVECAIRDIMTPKDKGQSV